MISSMRPHSRYLHYSHQALILIRRHRRSMTAVVLQNTALVTDVRTPRHTRCRKALALLRHQQNRRKKFSSYKIAPGWLCLVDRISSKSSFWKRNCTPSYLELCIDDIMKQYLKWNLPWTPGRSRPRHPRYRSVGYHMSPPRTQHPLKRCELRSS